MTFKAKIRIPTDAYAFIEVEHDGTPEEITSIYNEFKKYLLPQQGITQKEFNNAIDIYLTDGTMVSEIYAQMSQEQKQVIQEIKKSIKRLRHKETC